LGLKKAGFYKGFARRQENHKKWVRSATGNPIFPIAHRDRAKAQFNQILSSCHSPPAMDLEFPGGRRDKILNVDQARLMASLINSAVTGDRPTSWPSGFA
jgi:hypothetical protein